MNQQTVSFSIGVPMSIPFERQSFMGKTIFIVHLVHALNQFQIWHGNKCEYLSLNEYLVMYSDKNQVDIGCQRIHVNH